MSSYLTVLPTAIYHGVYFASSYLLNTRSTVVANNTPLKFKKYGWKRDLPDKRDHWFENNYLLSVEKPLNKVDLRDKCPQVYNQGELGSCTANALACAIQYDELKQNLLNNQTPSRLFIYYNERDMEGNIDNDTGASLRDGVKSINNVGYCDETQWPYDIEKFKYKPTQDCYDYARKHKALTYKRVQQDETHIKSVLNMGFPVVFGISVYESFESERVAKTGIVPLPENSEIMLGGHAIVLVGYDEEKRLFTFRNSWGEDWGDKGYGYLPYEYVCDNNLASDFWVINKIC
jgi:C1A family cysteine protease